MNKKVFLSVVLITIAAMLLPVIFPLIISTENAYATQSSTEILSEGESPLTNGTLKLVTGLRDDIFPKLKESAEIKVVYIFMRYCVREGAEYNFRSPDDMNKGRWFWWGNTVLGSKFGEKTTALWLNNLLIPSVGASASDGAPFCKDGQDISDSEWRQHTGIGPVYATYIGRGYSKSSNTNDYKNVLCRNVNGKYFGGIYTRYLKEGEVDWTGGKKYKLDPGCEDIADTDPSHWSNEKIHAFLDIYPEWIGYINYYQAAYQYDDWEDAARETFEGMSLAYLKNYGATPPFTVKSFQETYDRYIYTDTKDYQLSGFHNGNQYLPPWEEDGWSYNNVDGYFNYIRDLSLRCENYISIKDEDTEGYLPLTTINKEDLRITLKKRWYKVSGAKPWTGSLSGENPVTSCEGLIERIEYLRNHPNGGGYIYRGDATSNEDYKKKEEENRGKLSALIGEAKEMGYEGIVLSVLQDACDNMIDAATGRNAYVVLKEKLQEYLTYEGITEDDKAVAEEAINKIEAAEDAHTFMVSSGVETEPNGKVYECLDVAGLQQMLDEYTPPSTIIQQEEDMRDMKYNCYSNAGPLGWILCPIIDGLKQFIVQQYSQWVAPALQINPVLFGGDVQYNQTYQAWAIFRDIGNVLFILLFIVVIFSQISGIGIDNYNLKKIIPKLIVAVILINLSYIICQVAIDISNIVGRQIGGFFQTIINRVTHPSVINTSEGITIRATDRGSWGDVDSWGSSFKQNWLGNSTLIIVVAGLGIAAFLYKGLAVIIPVLMMVLSCAISILGLIVILGLRQAAAVVLVVVSPLAFACYMLPNTRSLFDRWFKALQGLLLAYPICSLLVYGGDLAGTILLHAGNGNTWVIISAAIISIAPIFLIPKVIRKSMAGIAGAITGATNKVKGRATSKASERLKNSRMGDRERYNQNMRGQMRSAAVSSYGAKRGAKTLQRKKYQDPSKLKLARSRRTYNAALAAVNAENSSAQDAFENQFQNQDDNKIISDIGASIQNDGKMNINMVVAGLNRMTNDGNAIAMLRSISQTDAYKEMIKNDPQANQRIADAMMSRRGNVIAQSMGKLMAKGEGVQEMFDNGSLRDKVQGAGVGVMASQSKDAFNMEGAENLFSDDQIRAGLAAGYGGDTDRAFGRMLQRIQTKPDGTASEEGNERMDNIIEGMTAEQVSKMSETGLAAATAGRADRVVKKAERAIEQLNTEGAKNLRNNMNVKVAKAIGVHGVGAPDPTKATPTGTPTPAPGPSPAPDSGSSDPAPVDIDIDHSS